MRTKFNLLNEIPDFLIKLGSFVIYNLFYDMFVKQHFGLNSIWNFYEAKIYYSDTCFLPFRLCFGLERHLAISIQKHVFQVLSLTQLKVKHCGVEI